MLLAVVLLVGPIGVRAQGTSAPTMQECIKNCTDCNKICVETLAYCRKQGGKHAAAGHLRALQDCAELCQTSVSFMRRGSALHGRTCGLCAAACEQCAKSCEQFPNDAKMKACAAQCRRCARSCQAMAKMMG
jgi:hypothetical protein